MDFAVSRRWDGLVNSRMQLAMLALPLLWLAVALVLELRFKARLRRLAPRPDDVADALAFLFKEYVEGRMRPELLEALRHNATDAVNLYSANTAVCLEVAAGRYVQALLWRESCEEADLQGDGELLLRINEAEAMVNLGRLEESLLWMDRTVEGWDLARAGAATHRAWCLAMLGRTGEAAEELARCSDHQLGPQFRSEWHFAAASIATSSGRWLEADTSLKKMQLFAQRASTKRNVHFGRGLLLAVQGLHGEALPHFEKGAASVYVGQGGDALLAWGDSLKTLGRDEEAQRAWMLCRERDPQSPAAEKALVRQGEASQTRVA